MVKRRARLSDDNDPLSSTDRVLAGFEQVSKSASQEANTSIKEQVDTSESQQPTKPELASPRELTSQQVEKVTSQQDSKSYSQRPTTEKLTNSSITPKEETSQQVDQATSQQVENIEKPKLRKSTFQISEAVLNQLDQLHLTLQLELGKANAPYKEVIVEEALVRLLEQVISDRPALIEVLVSKQKSRDKS